MSLVTELTFHLFAARTMKDCGKHELAHHHHRKAMKLAWFELPNGTD